MKKKSVFSKMQIQIILAYSLVIIIAVTSLGVFSFRQYRELLQENSRKHARDISAAIGAALDTHIDSYGEFSRNAFMSEEVHSMLDDDTNANNRQTLFQKYCASSFGYKRYLDAIYMVTEKGTVLVNKGYTRNLPANPETYEWYQRLLDAQGGMVVDYGPSWMNDTYPSRGNVVTVGRLMKSVIVQQTSTYYNPTGAIIFELSPSFMSSLLSYHDLSGTQLILTDDQDHIIFDFSGKNGGRALSECYAGIKDNGSYKLESSDGTTDYFVHKESLKYGWSLFFLFDLSEVTTRESLFLRYILVLALAITIVSLLLSVLFSKNIVSPIEQIRANMRKIESGHLDERLTGDFPYELEGIADSYNHMLDSLQEQINVNYVMKLETLESKYRALEAQINPHFIFNVLDMINSEMILSGNAASAKTIRSLAKLIRYNLDNCQEMVTIESDIAYIETYCSLLQEVYPDFDGVTIEIPEDLKDHRIPSHCIQPLVENAIKHGFPNIDHPGHLDIRAFIKDDLLNVTVRDNGKGIQENELSELNERLSASENDIEGNRSIGLINVHRRLRLKFGPDYGLHITSISGEYTEVTARLPK